MEASTDPTTLIIGPKRLASSTRIAEKRNGAIIFHWVREKIRAKVTAHIALMAIPRVECRVTEIFVFMIFRNLRVN